MDKNTMTNRIVPFLLFILLPSMILANGTKETPLGTISIEQNRSHYSRLIHKEIELSFHLEKGNTISFWKYSFQDLNGKIIDSKTGSVQKKKELSFFSKFFPSKDFLDLPTSWSWPIDNLSDGTYQFSLFYGNTAGKEASETCSFVLDSIPANATITVLSPLFSPDGDGIKDILHIEQKGSIENTWHGFFKNEKGESVRSFTWEHISPPSFVWDGKNEQGEILPDGYYSYFLNTEDMAGNTVSKNIQNIEIDTVNTTFSLLISSNALSPLGAEKFRTLHLSINSYRESRLLSWEISLKDENDTTIRQWNGEKQKLDLFTPQIYFDGRNEWGDHYPDGNYQFLVQLYYENGSQPSSRSSFFRIDSRVPEGRIRSSVNKVQLGSSNPVIVYHDLSSYADWKGIIKNNTGEIIRTIILDTRIAIPRSEPIYEWNLLDDTSSIVPAGVYTYMAQGVSKTGIIGESNITKIYVEESKQTLLLLADKNEFSSEKQTVRIYPRADAEQLQAWSVQIISPNNTLIKEWKGHSSLPIALTWDGRDEYGILQKDGNYKASAFIITSNGSKEESEPITLSLDNTAPPEILVKVNTKLFSPNNDGKLDTVTFQHSSIKPIEQSANYIAYIRDAEGSLLRKWTWNNTFPDSLTWDGRDSAGNIVPDKTWFYQIVSEDRLGNTNSSSVVSIKTDSRIPRGQLSVDKTLFSPNNDGFADILSLRSVISLDEGIEHWKIYAIQEKINKNIVLLESSQAQKNIPVTFNWNGLSSQGTKLDDGRYYIGAELTFIKGDVLTLKSTSFVIDTLAPKANLTISPLPFSPDGDAYNDELTIDLRISDASDLQGWHLAILDPYGNPFTSFNAKDAPQEAFYWDGYDLDNNLVEAAQDYKYQLTVRDIAGNTHHSEGKIPIDILVLHDGDRLKIRISSISFAASSASLRTGNTELDERNQLILDRIAETLIRFPSYRIRIEGHAVNISGTEREEKNELAPLSLARAKTVLEELVKRNIERSRLEARGLGGTEPLVSHNDTQFRWKNRRVEFILLR